MEGHGTKVSVHSVFCFTLLFECVLQGKWLIGGWYRGESPSGVRMSDRAGCRFMAMVGARGLGWCLGHV